MRKIPSKWTKRMFLSASFYALQNSGDPNVLRKIADDLHDVLLFGFDYWKQGEFDEFSVNYRQYSTDLFK